MAYIFMDESGDLGFDFTKQKTSKHFVVTFLFVPDERTMRAIRKIVKKIFRGFTKHELKHHPGVLHAFKEKPVTRKRLLEELKKHDVSILSIILNKKKVYTNMQNEKQVLYNYVTNILLDRIFTRRLIPLDRLIKLVASKRETNVFLNLNFQQYLQRQAKGNHLVSLDVSIKTTSEEKCLQVADCISWSLFRKHEHNDPFYADIIKTRIAEERFLFP